MKKILTIALFLCVSANVVSAQRIFPGLGAQRAGISGFPFLKIGVNPRAAAMGESFIAIADDASSLYWNPAASVRTKNNEVMFAHTLWFADVQHSFGAYVHHVSESDAIGASVTAVTTNDMERTTVLQPHGDGSYFSYRDLAIGLTYSRAMTDQFSFGITGKYVHETLAELTMHTFLVDIGAYYYTGYANSRFAFVLTNFGGTAKPTGSASVYGIGTVTSFQEFSPPTIFRLSFAIEPWQTEEHRLTTAIQLNHPNDNAENLAVGIEYAWTETVFLRGGYKLNVEEQQVPSFGIGFKIPAEFTSLSFDYASSSYGVLGTAHRFSIAMTL
jgi:hypothetical protein